MTGIGEAHGKSGAQVALRWIAQHGVPLSTKANSVKYLSEDIDIFDWSLTDTEMAHLDAATSPSGKPSFVCTKESVVEES